MDGELIVVPGSVRMYSTGLDGLPDPDAPIMASDEQAERDRLQKVVERGEAAEEELAFREWRRIREGPGVLREFADADDPDASPVENETYRAFRAWKRGEVR